MPSVLSVCQITPRAETIPPLQKRGRINTDSLLEPTLFAEGFALLRVLHLTRISQLANRAPRDSPCFQCMRDAAKEPPGASRSRVTKVRVGQRSLENCARGWGGISQCPSNLFYVTYPAAASETREVIHRLPPL